MKALFSVLFSIVFTLGVFAQIPQLNSYDPAQATVFIDFDGQYVTGTPWNWGGPITAQPSGFSSSAITEIFNRVAEDFRIFNLNITTDSTVYAGAPVNKRVRIIVTPTYQWYGMAGGVSLVGSFVSGNNTPAWVFSGLLGNSVKSVAEAISHEAGHTLGLQHQSVYKADCSKDYEYGPGQGSGEIGWAPIMGVGYYKNLTTWYNGTNAINCSTFQNDINIIAGSPNNFGLRTDDHADTHLSATPITLTTIDFTAEGLVNSATDKDVFQFTLTDPTNFKLNAIPENVGLSNSGANVDIRVSLLNGAADTIGQYNPTDLLNAGVDSNLNSGTYYLVIEGVGNVNLSDYGSLGYYLVSGTLDNILPVHHLILKGVVQKGAHALNWDFIADEPVKRVEVQYSKDGVNFMSLMQLPGNTNTFSWKPADRSKAYYRVRVVTVADESSYYSNIITLQDTNNYKVSVVSTIISGNITVTADKDYSYQLLDETGRLILRGRINNGVNTINAAAARNGLLLLRIQGINESHTFRLIKQ
jgi:hypothetical protein